MTIRRPKKWLTYTRLAVVFCLAFLIDRITLDNKSQTIILNDNLNKSVIAEVIEENHETNYQEELYTAVGEFAGDLTGYAGDCPLCSGIVACAPRTNVLESGIFFNDSQYGTVRMVATSSKYPCGSIIRFSIPKLGEEPIIAVVMDRGVGGNDVDLLVENEDFARKNVGRVRNQTFEILRLGW